MTSHAVGIDLGGTKIEIAVIDDAGAIGAAARARDLIRGSRNS